MTESRPLAYFDSNVFIVAFESANAHSDHAWWIMRAIEAGEIGGVTSELTLAELLVKPLEQQRHELVAAYNAVITSGPNFDVLPVSRNILIEAATVRAGRGSVRLPDAVHIATARSASCGFFVSDDRRLSIPQDMKRVTINPFTLDDILAGE